MIASMNCPFCNDVMVLVGGGWVCISPHCENAGNLQEVYGED